MSGNNYIEIKTEDIPSHLSKHTETTEKTAVLLDLKRGLWVFLGVPVKDKDDSNLEIDIPSDPHVFMVHELYVKDDNHEDMLLRDVPVIFAHGYRDRDDVWRFSNSQSVVETVNAYDDYARLNNLPLIEFVIACNKDGTENPMRIHIKDFPSNKIIAQAIGKTMFMQAGYRSNISKDGRVVMRVGVEGDTFWGLDDLVGVKDVGNKIEVLD